MRPSDEHWCGRPPSPPSRPHLPRQGFRGNLGARDWASASTVVIRAGGAWMRGVGCCSGLVVWCRLHGVRWASRPLVVLGWVSVGRARRALVPPSPSSGHPGVVASTFRWSALGVCVQRRQTDRDPPEEEKKKQKQKTKKRWGPAERPTDRALRTPNKSRPHERVPWRGPRTGHFELPAGVWVAVGGR